MKKRIIKPLGQDKNLPEEYKLTRVTAETRAEHDAMMIAKASHFTTCRHLGRGKRTTKEHPTLEAAREHAKEFSDGRTMIYAVSNNQSVWVENI